MGYSKTTHRSSNTSPADRTCRRSSDTVPVLSSAVDSFRRLRSCPPSVWCIMEGRAVGARCQYRPAGTQHVQAPRQIPQVFQQAGYANVPAARRSVRGCRAGMGIGFRPDTAEPSLLVPEEKGLDLPTDFGLSVRQLAALGLAGEGRERKAEPLPVSALSVAHSRRSLGSEICCSVISSLSERYRGGVVKASRCSSLSSNVWFTCHRRHSQLEPGTEGMRGSSMLKPTLASKQKWQRAALFQAKHHQISRLCCWMAASATLAWR